MKTYKVVISNPAKRDLRDIKNYTKNTWGIEKSDAYIDEIKVKFIQLGEHPFSGVNRDDIIPEARCLVVSQHQVFYRIKEDQILVLRVLHHKMDPSRNLSQ